MQAHSFGNWLKTRRKARDLTQSELANQVGCSAAAIRKLEAEERRPSAQIVERLAEIFAVPQNEQANFLRFARGEMRSAPADTKEDFPWKASGALTRSNLPVTVTSLIGREKEIADVRNYLSKNDIRLVTLIGPPGIGKTRLGIEAARALLSDFPDGVFFVALALLDDPSLIPQTVAQSLGYVGARNISITDQLRESIGRKQMLLVLDNCEHLIEAVAALASALLSACSSLKILATSRESLRIPGEWLYPVPALDAPDETLPLDPEAAAHFPALTLFAERARAVRSDFTLKPENVQTVAKVCAHLDGLPLAIELIAARMRLMSPDVLLARLDNQFILSADGMRALSTRQRTLNNAIGWSYSLLSEAEQRLFAYLSVFSRGFTLGTAEAIFSSSFKEKSVSDLLSLLLDKSLLQRIENPTAPGEATYIMLVTIQEFARQRLRESGEETEICNRHLAFFLDFSVQAAEQLRGPGQIEWLRRLGAALNNLRTALDWAIETGQTKLALQMVRKLDWFWFIRSDHNEGRQWLDRVLKMLDAPLHPGAQAEAITQLAHHTWLQIGAKEAQPFVEQALSIARANNDQHNIARALSVLGLVEADQKNFASAWSALEESKTLYQEVRDEWGYAHALTCLGHIPARQGDLTTSISLRKQALVLFRKLGDRYFQSAILCLIGDYSVKQGDLKQGISAIREATLLAQQLESKYEIAMVLMSFADFARIEGNYARALYLYSTAKNAYNSIGAWTMDDEMKLENSLIICRAALSESEFEEVMQEGRAMTREQAIAYALEDQE